jgi:hypothetical protein
MKTININLDITSFSSAYDDLEPKNSRFPCPRVSVFQSSSSPKQATNITETGTYNYTFNLEDNQECGIDFFTWKTGNIKLITDLPIETGDAGDYLDQIRNTIYINEAGTYNISARIKGNYKIPFDDRTYTFFNQGGCKMWETGILLD